MDDRSARLSLRRDAKVSARRPWIIVLVLVLLGLAVWGAWALAHSAKSGGGGAPGAFGRRGGRPPTTVGVAQASLANMPVTLDALGTVTPVATVTVRPQVGGVVTQILFREGQMVKKGQTLAVIDPRPLQMALLQAQGALTRDAAQLANARLQLKRYQTLLAQDSIARQDVDTQAATVKQLEGTVMTDRAAVGTAKLNLEWSRVAAPFDGRVGLRIADVGNLVAANDANGIVVETQVAPIDVQFTVPQDQAPEVAARAKGGALAVVALDSTRTKTLASGTFTTLDNQVDPTTGTVRGKARFGNADGSLFPNQFVNVRVTLNTLNDVVVTPLSALRTGPNGDFVWIVKPDQTVTMRPVKRGQTTPTQVVILSGLSVGEKVVTEGGDRLTEGGKIMLPGQMRAHGGKGGHRRGGGSEAAAPAGAGGRPSAQVEAPGGFTPSPEMQAARQAVRQACGADLQKLCAGAEGREAMMCLRQNADQVSAACKAALAKLPHRAPGGGQGGGAG
ncbi:MAG TPA: efflux RND transporter periplasmic adaptor subunit [Phenylobacterium sp.]|uniref:efflux RND transporter periplasmic adaptor subunit n=1 Tax=Phenylobacterium sp. TaxID=1871053 RepID=UPI002B4A7506|nr:efflux RND transporter periplasmic adaptor subunit [Phenylobacterium sp.]HKR88938.1 efflux RND transporter periplasmic adaptor subunit [Phenylobacterium sp.]